MNNNGNKSPYNNTARRNLVTRTCKARTKKSIKIAEYLSTCKPRGYPGP